MALQSSKENDLGGATLAIGIIENRIAKVKEEQVVEQKRLEERFACKVRELERQKSELEAYQKRLIKSMAAQMTFGVTAFYSPQKRGREQNSGDLPQTPVKKVKLSSAEHVGKNVAGGVSSGVVGGVSSSENLLVKTVNQCRDVLDVKPVLGQGGTVLGREGGEMAQSSVCDVKSNDMKIVAVPAWKGRTGRKKLTSRETVNYWLNCPNGDVDMDNFGQSREEDRGVVNLGASCDSSLNGNAGKVDSTQDVRVENNPVVGVEIKGTTVESTNGNNIMNIQDAFGPGVSERKRGKEDVGGRENNSGGGRNGADRSNVQKLKKKSISGKGLKKTIVKKKTMGTRLVRKEGSRRKFSQMKRTDKCNIGSSLDTCSGSDSEVSSVSGQLMAKEDCDIQLTLEEAEFAVGIRDKVTGGKDFGPREEHLTVEAQEYAVGMMNRVTSAMDVGSREKKRSGEDKSAVGNSIVSTLKGKSISKGGLQKSVMKKRVMKEKPGAKKVGQKINRSKKEIGQMKTKKAKLKAGGSGGKAKNTRKLNHEGELDVTGEVVQRGVLHEGDGKGQSNSVDGFEDDDDDDVAGMVDAAILAEKSVMKESMYVLDQDLVQGVGCEKGQSDGNNEVVRGRVLMGGVDLCGDHAGAQKLSRQILDNVVQRRCAEAVKVSEQLSVKRKILVDEADEECNMGDIYAQQEGESRNLQDQEGIGERSERDVEGKCYKSDKVSEELNVKRRILTGDGGNEKYSVGDVCARKGSYAKEGGEGGVMSVMSGVSVGVNTSSVIGGGGDDAVKGMKLCRQNRKKQLGKRNTSGDIRRDDGNEKYSVGNVCAQNGGYAQQGGVGGMMCVQSGVSKGVNASGVIGGGGDDVVKGMKPCGQNRKKQLGKRNTGGDIRGDDGNEKYSVGNVCGQKGGHARQGGVGGMMCVQSGVSKGVNASGVIGGGGDDAVKGMKPCGQNRKKQLGKRNTGGDIRGDDGNEKYCVGNVCGRKGGHAQQGGEGEVIYVMPVQSGVLQGVNGSIVVGSGGGDVVEGVKQCGANGKKELAERNTVEEWDEREQNLEVGYVGNGDKGTNGSTLGVIVSSCAARVSGENVGDISGVEDVSNLIGKDMDRRGSSDVRETRNRKRKLGDIDKLSLRGTTDTVDSRQGMRVRRKTEGMLLSKDGGQCLKPRRSMRGEKNVMLCMLEDGKTLRKKKVSHTRTRVSQKKDGGCVNDELERFEYEPNGMGGGESQSRKISQLFMPD